MSLPSHTKALTVHSIGTPLNISVTSVPVTSPPAPGTVAVRVLSAYASPGLPKFWDGTVAHLKFPVPFVGGAQAVGRVVATGPDATSLKPGDLVFVDSYVLSRDDPVSSQILLGLHEGNTEATRGLMRNAWRDGVFKTIASAPLENTHRLNEPALLTSLSYTPSELVIALARLVVAYGGTSAVSLKAGQTILVAPATGYYSGAIAEVAVALGARVIALGRSAAKLQPLIDALATAYPHSPRVQPAVMTGDLAADTAAIRALLPPGAAGADAFIDITPPVPGTPAHLPAALAALRPGAKAAFMGVLGGVEIDYASIMWRNISIKGQYMYTREQLQEVLRMVEAGVIRVGKRLGHEVQGEFDLEEWEAALVALEGANGWDKGVTFTPQD